MLDKLSEGSGQYFQAVGLCKYVVILKYRFDKSGGPKIIDFGL